MTKRSYKKKKQTKNFSFVYILLILIAVAGLTVLVMSFLVPPKKKDVDTTPMNTAINETEKKQEKKKRPTTGKIQIRHLKNMMVKTQ